MLRPRLAHSENALSVLDAMEQEHERIDPLLAAVDAAFAQREGSADGADDWPGEDRLADVIEVLASTLTGHLAHEERDGLPLIGVALTSAEWRGVGFKIARKNGLSRGGEMFAWMLDGAGARTPPPRRARSRRRFACSTGPSGSPASRRPRAGKASPRSLAICLRFRVLGHPKLQTNRFASRSRGRWARRRAGSALGRGDGGVDLNA